MIVLAAIFFISAILVLRAKRPAEVPNSSPLYRVDNRVVASVLFVLAAALAVLAWTT